MHAEAHTCGTSEHLISKGRVYSIVWMLLTISWLFIYPYHTHVYFSTTAAAGCSPECAECTGVLRLSPMHHPLRTPW